jgi:phospholipid/cholesterol/gamma-HCH transport system substrate-binding protein
MNLLPGMNMLPPMEEHSFLPSSESTLGKALLAQGLVDKPLANDAIQGIISQIEPMLIEVRGTVAGVTRALSNVNAALEGRPDSMLGGTLADAKKLLANVDQVLMQKNQESSVLIGNINSITADFARLTSQLQDPKGLIPKLLDPQGSLKTLLDDKNELYNQLTQILGQVNSTLSEVKGLTAYLNRSTPQISGLMEDAKTTLKKTDDVLTGLGNNPLLKGGIPERKAQTSAVSGSRDEDF